MIIDQFRIGFGKGTSKKWVIPTCLYLVSDKMRLKSFDFLLFAKLPNWHEEWCMLWWLPSSIQFFEGECNAFTFYYVYFDGWEGKKSPSFCRKNYKWGLPALPPLEKYRKKFNAISAHDLKSYRRSQVGLSNIHSRWFRCSNPHHLKILSHFGQVSLSHTYKMRHFALIFNHYKIYFSKCNIWLVHPYKMQL